MRELYTGIEHTHTTCIYVGPAVEGVRLTVFSATHWNDGGRLSPMPPIRSPILSPGRSPVCDSERSD